MDDEFLAVAEVASILKLNQQMVRNWLDRGEMPSVRVGSRRVACPPVGLRCLPCSGSRAKAAPADAGISDEPG
jgi:excisionase family DNA binding protein